MQSNGLYLLRHQLWLKLLQSLLHSLFTQSCLTLSRAGDPSSYEERAIASPGARSNLLANSNQLNRCDGLPIALRGAQRSEHRGPSMGSSIRQSKDHILVGPGSTG